MANEICKTVLTASVGEHIAAFRTINIGDEAEIRRARKALREWIGTQQDDAFRNLGDLGVLSVLLEEFAEFAIFMGESIHRDNTQSFVSAQSGSA